jgi:GNAT superfamily N-acetyltransferase
MTFTIRLAKITDIDVLASIELAAAKRFDANTLDHDLQNTTVPIEQLQYAQAAAMLWVAESSDQVIVGFLSAELLDSNLHISEMSVLPSYGRQGIGAALLSTAKSHASYNGFTRVTLTTFETVPWNAPFYTRHGFREMDSHEIGSNLASLIAREHSLGLKNKVAMSHLVE